MGAQDVHINWWNIYVRTKNILNEAWKYLYESRRNIIVGFEFAILGKSIMDDLRSELGAEFSFDKSGQSYSCKIDWINH